MTATHKVALILGSISGIGKGVALGLSKKGIRVALNYYDREERLGELKQDLKETGTPFLIAKTDLLKTERIPNLIQRVVGRFGRIDILVNNIERGGWPVVHGPYIRKQWDIEMATTLRAKWWVFNEALSYLKGSGDGVVINLSSIAGIVGRSGPAALVFK